MATKVPSELIADLAITGSKLHTALGNTGVTANSSGLHIGQDVATSATVQFQTVTGAHAGTIAAAATGTTQANTDNSAKMATTAFVTNKIQELIGGAPSTLNDLNELAAAINDDASYNSTLTTALATKAPIASPTFAGNTRVNGDFSVGAASGEDRFVVAPQAAGSGTILISYNNAANAYEPLIVDFETLALRTSGTPRLSFSSAGTLTLGGDIVNSSNGIAVATFSGLYAASGSVSLMEWERSGGAVKAEIMYKDATTDMELGTTSAHSFALKTGGARRLNIDNSTGGIGIPGRLAVMSSASHGSYDFYNNGTSYFNGGVTVDDVLSVTGASAQVSVNGHIYLNGAGYELRSKDTGGNVRTIARVNSSNELEYGWSANAPVKFMGGGSYTERMRIHTNGFVGIGTDNPSHQLHVHSDENKSLLIERDSGSNAVNLNEFSTHYSLSILNRTSGSYLNFGGNAAHSALQATTSAASATAKHIALNPYGGNVGIGTATPGEKLEVNGIIQIKRSGDHPAMRFVEDTTTRAYMGSGDWAINGGADDDFGISAAGTGDLLFGTTGGVEKMRIKNGGDVLFNVDSDSQLLIGNGGTNATKIFAGAGDELYIGAANAYALRFLNDGTNNVVFDNSSNIGIATASPTATLQVGTTPDGSSTAGSLVHLASSTASSTVNGFTHLKLDCTTGHNPGDIGAQIMFNQGYHGGNQDYTQPVGAIRGRKTGPTNNYGGGLQFMYQPDSGALGVLPGMTMTGTGRVGIGTNNPVSTLQIGDFTSSEQLTIAVSQNGTGKIFFTDNNTTEGGYVKNTGTTYGSDFVFGGTWNTDLDSVAIRVRQNSSSGAASQWKAKMGIGTTAPIAGLEVRGFNESKDATDADDATGAEEPILMLRGSNGASVSEWVHSTKATAPGQGTQTPMISWYRFDMPGGWSGTGTPGFLEIHNQMSGMHASGSACEKFYLSLPNEHGNISTAGGLQNTSISRYYSYTANVGAYTTSLSTLFYYGNSSSFGYAAGAIFMKVTHASREPFFTMYAKYIGGTGSSRNYPQKMHFLGTEVTNNHQPSNISALSVHDGRGML